MPRWPEHERETTADLWEELRLDAPPRLLSPPEPVGDYDALLIPHRAFAYHLWMAYVEDPDAED